MQPFKGDYLEGQFYNSFAPIARLLSNDKNLFMEGAYTAGPLGDLIYDLGAAPLTNAIKKSIFRDVFNELFNEAFVQVGTFEAYISVFKKIFGDTVVITFTVPAPGKLTIDIEAAGVELSNWVAQHIESNAYVYDKVVTQDGDYIVFQTIKGFQSQYELEQMLYEMVPAGIFTDINLSLGV